MSSQSAGLQLNKFTLLQNLNLNICTLMLIYFIFFISLFQRNGNTKCSVFVCVLRQCFGLCENAEGFAANLWSSDDTV